MSLSQVTESLSSSYVASLTQTPQPQLPAEEKTAFVAKNFFKSPILRTVGLILTGALILGLVANPIGLAVGGTVLLSAIVFGIVHRKQIYLEGALLYQSLNKNYSYYTKIDDHIVLGGLPLANQNHLQELKELGVQVMITLTEPWEDEFQALSADTIPAEVLQDAGMNVFSFPFPDFRAPDPETLEKIADLIDFCVGQKVTVCVRCKAGIGRSATAVAAFYKLYHGKTTDDAATFVKAQRKEVGLNRKQKGALEPLKTGRARLHTQAIAKLKENILGKQKPNRAAAAEAPQGKRPCSRRWTGNTHISENPYRCS